MASLTDEELKRHVQALIPRVDLESTGVKQFIKLLSKELDGMDLKPRKTFIKQTLTEELAKLHEEKEAEEEEESEKENSDDEEEEEEEISTPTKGRGGFSQKKEISDELAAFLGQGKMMARTDIVKRLWEYIREHNLQNPSNRQEIFLDSAMKQVFGCDSFTMFTMNKYIGAHIHPFKPVDLTTSSTPTRSKKRKAPASSEKKRKAGTQPPYQLSDELSQVVGKPILPRPQVVSAIWEYIRANNLQNPNDRREILCDAKLQAVMKKSKVSMFKMNQLITPHLLEKVDRSLYQHEDGSDEE